MLRWFRRAPGRVAPSSDIRPDGLNKTATQIAVELIEGQGGRTYQSVLKRLFRNTPGLIEDVSPEYRERLKQVLESKV